ncbi:peptidoglycan-binding domain-containing protein [Streptomyces thermoalcalitolerans]|uniref:Peptidoglycan binding-like domain-containing protein n=1 Tax=Streptomyces thermoalcalitolerans TaxID=65605 RepID=A0ABN1NEN8_9ACTN
MEEQRGHVCPECKAPRGADGVPSCACGSRASDAPRDARTAEAETAEDFSPLRVRPYVEIQEREQGTENEGAGQGSRGGESARECPPTAPAQTAPMDATMPLRAISANTPPPARTAPAGTTAPAQAAPTDTPTPPAQTAPADPAASAQATPAATTAPTQTIPTGATAPAQTAPMDATMPLRAISANTPSPARTAPAGTTAPAQAAPADATTPLQAVPALPTPLAPQQDGPNASDLSLFESTAAGPAVKAEGPRPAPRGGRRRRTAVVLAGSAAVAAVAAAGFAGGLLSPDSPRQDRASHFVRESAPEASEDVSGAPSPTASTVSAPASAPASASGSPSAGESTSPSPSAPASSTASQSPSASPSPTGAGPSAGPEQSEPAGPATTLKAPAPENPGPVLRRGDQGAEVAELQQRLRQLHLYTGKADGFYSGRVERAVRTYQWTRGIREDEPGVYGPATRARLEAETGAS